LEFGIYRDGDNNLDQSQSAVIRQARIVSAENTAIQFTVEDTSSGAFGSAATRRTTIQDGREVLEDQTPSPDDMASLKTLASFVARTLDNAEGAGAKQTWIELVDHGAGDGGGLEADSFHEIMPMPQIAQAIADGMRLHAAAHPEDAGRTVDGVVANQCLMASLGFAEGYILTRAKRPVAFGRARSVRSPCARCRCAATPKRKTSGRPDAERHFKARKYLLAHRAK
jgi:hypothetical protein